MTLLIAGCLLGVAGLALAVCAIVAAGGESEERKRPCR